jgi:hypothetical protein
MPATMPRRGDDGAQLTSRPARAKGKGLRRRSAGPSPNPSRRGHRGWHPARSHTTPQEPRTRAPQRFRTVRDSLGLFQMRPASGWGTVAELMDPEYQAKAFFGGPSGPNSGSPRGLLDIAGWQLLDPGEAAQAVEVSAYPERYQNYQPVADSIVAALTRVQPASPGASGPAIPETSRVVFPLPAGTYTNTNSFGWRTDPYWRRATVSPRGRSRHPASTACRRAASRPPPRRQPGLRHRRQRPESTCMTSTPGHIELERARAADDRLVGRAGVARVVKDGHAASFDHRPVSGGHVGRVQHVVRGANGPPARIR